MTKVLGLMRLSFVLAVLSYEAFAQSENTTPEIEATHDFDNATSRFINLKSENEAIQNLNDIESSRKNDQDIDYIRRQLVDSENTLSSVDERVDPKIIETITLSPNVNISRLELHDKSRKVDIFIDICDICFCNESMYADLSPYLAVICYNVEKELDIRTILWPKNLKEYDVEVTFQKLGWTEIPELPLSKQIVSISFYDNLIKEISPKAFWNLPNTVSLTLKKNDLRDIAPSMFHGLKYIEDLDLSENKLYNVEHLDFNEMVYLKRLWLRENNLKAFPEKELSKIEKLEFLDLSHNAIYFLTKENSIMSQLLFLDLSYNNIHTIFEKDFSKGFSLKVIDLSHNEISQIDSNAFHDCTNLTDLILSNNKLTSLPSLPDSIQSLFVKNNVLQDWINIPKNVINLDISNNELSTMTEESYPDLETLDMTGNHLYEFNRKNPLNKLKILVFSNNRLKMVPANFDKTILPSLEELYIDGNPFQELIFTGDITLRKLSATNLHEIESLNETSFKTLSGRPVQNINGSSMQADACVDIIISQCKSLTTITNNTFQNIPLCSLDLSFNNLRTLSKDVADWSSISRGVNLQGNPWDCDCSLQWILDDLLENLINNYSHVLADLRCDSPRNVNGFRFVHWYKWQIKAFCRRTTLFGRMSSSYTLLESSSDIERSDEVDWKTIGLVIAITVLTIVSIGLIIYLAIGKKREEKALRMIIAKKRQSLSDAQKLNKNGGKRLIRPLLDA